MKSFLLRVMLGALLTGGALMARAVTGPADEARAVLSDWPAASRGAAEALIERLGAPDKVGRDELVWNGRAAVYRDPGATSAAMKADGAPDPVARPARTESVTRPLQAPGEPQPKGY